VYGGPEQIHLEAWRTRATLLQTTQAPGEVRVDTRSRSSSSSAQGLHVQTTSPHGSRQKKQLLLYLAATTHEVITAIVVERQEDGHTYPVQRPVYFASEVLSESKARYQPVQKLLYAVLITSRKLRHYFQEYSISVVADYPLSDILRNQDATGRISKWAVELSALNIDFKLRTAIKLQALVDFMAEWRKNQLPTPTERPKHWVMYFDGSLKLEGAGAGVLLISPTGEQLKYVMQIF
jgi:hypothetical protein